MEECKVLKENSEKYSTHQLHKEARSSGNKIRGKSAKFYDKMKGVNRMVSHDKPAPKKKKGENKKKNLRLNNPVQAHQRMDGLIASNA